MDSRYLRASDRPKAEIKEIFDGSSVFRELLRLVLPLMVKSMNRENYKEAGWPYLRAYDDGYNRAIQDVKDLITSKED